MSVLPKFFVRSLLGKMKLLYVINIRPSIEKSGISKDKNYRKISLFFKVTDCSLTILGKYRYIEWSTHEPSPGDYRFTGQEDVEHFIQLAIEEGLLVILRPGPFICAERDMVKIPTLLATNFLATFRNEITTILTPSTSEGGEWGRWGWSRFSFWRSLITKPKC